MDALDSMFSFLEGLFHDNSVDEKSAFCLKLAGEEIFTNMVRHNTSSAKFISLGLEILPDRIQLQLTDYDVKPFDPNSVEAVDIHQPIEQRKPGGLGMHLVKSVVDQIKYEYHEGELKVSMTKRRRA